MAPTPHGSVLEKQASWAQLRTLFTWHVCVCVCPSVHPSVPAARWGLGRANNLSQDRTASSLLRSQDQSERSWVLTLPKRDRTLAPTVWEGVKGAQGKGVLPPRCPSVPCGPVQLLTEARASNKPFPSNAYAGKSWWLQRDCGTKMARVGRLPFSRPI